MATVLNSIADRLTPSVPIEITYSAQPVAAGTKFTTIFAHRASTGGTAEDYDAYDLVNVADPDAARAEIEAVAGVGSEAGKMAYSFVAANAFASRSNFPAVRFVILPKDEDGFGPANEALITVRALRSDMLVSPYPASDEPNRTALLNFTAQISGPDRDLNGQFGSFATFASLAPLADAVLLAVNSRGGLVAYLQDTSSVPANSVQEVAAAHAGAMMSLGQPYRPAQGMAIGGLKPPVKRSDWILIDPSGASEQALRAGLSPLTVQPGGIVGFIRTRLTLNLKPDGVTTVTDYIDWQQVVKLYDYRESLYQVSQNPPFNNNPGGALASAEIAKKYEDEMVRVAADFEKLGMFQNVKLLAKYFVCVPSTSSRGRMDFRVPVDAVPGLYVIAGNIVAISDALNFTI